MSDSLLYSLLKALEPRSVDSGGRGCRARRLLMAALPALLLLVLGLLPSATLAQIVDDSTKNIYGARTTFILREADIMRQDTVGRMIDTTLTRLPQHRFWTHDSTYQQDLGNFGTASRPLLWEPNLQLGARLGRNVFDRYARNAATIPYYDTRSPYTFFRFHQGNPYEQIFELSYARSLKKNFNVGFAYERFGANKAIAVTSTREGQTEHSNFLFFARYHSPDDRYNAVANFSTARHRVAEQGGIQPQTSDFDATGKVDLKGLFDYQREVVNLTNALNREARDQVRLTHTYRLLGRGLTAFHTFDWRRQNNRFNDTELKPNGSTPVFYPEFRLSTAATDDRAEFRQLENTVGVMGRTTTIEYRLYGRHRNASLETRAADGEPAVLMQALPRRTFNQLFVGGTAAFRYRQFAIETAGEFKPSAQLNNTEYWLRGGTRLGPLSGELLVASYAPTLTELEFRGNHYEWDHKGSSSNAFSNTDVQQLRVRVAQQLGRHYLEAGGTIANIIDLIYYSEEQAGGAPRQLSGTRQLTTLSARYRVNFGPLYSDNQATYTIGGEDDKEGLRVPKIVGDARLYFQGFVFKKALLGQVGVQGYFQSRWKPYDYSPSTQQFFVQNHFTSRNIPVVDAFLSADIKTVNVFLKMAYINQFLPQSGYFTAPYYAALPRRFQFGIRWQFFN
ncbi:putative porin [Hymenobacter tenuis]